MRSNDKKLAIFKDEAKITLHIGTWLDGNHNNKLYSLIPFTMLVKPELIKIQHSRSNDPQVSVAHFFPQKYMKNQKKNAFYC